MWPRRIPTSSAPLGRPSRLRIVEPLAGTAAVAEIEPPLLKGFVEGAADQVKGYGRPLLTLRRSNDGGSRHAASGRQANEEIAWISVAKRCSRKAAAAQDKADADAARTAAACRPGGVSERPEGPDRCGDSRNRAQSAALGEYRNEIKKVAALKKEAARSGLGDTERSRLRSTLAAQW